jgi:hypothetical protein
MAKWTARCRVDWLAQRSFMFLAAGTLACAPGCRQAGSPDTKFGGVWTMSLGQRTFAVLQLTRHADDVTVELTMPDQFEIGQSGFRFAHISNQVKPRPISNVTVQAEHVRFRFTRPDHERDSDELDFTVTGPDTASLAIVDAPFEGWVLKRTAPGTRAAVSTDWDPLRSYSLEDGLPSNDELRRIVEADQQPRQQFFSLSEDQRAAVAADDARRRQDVRRLLAGGRLHTADDFKRAALIFQHGDKPDDYLLAHSLAMIAVANGDATAIWIATATLDRYLQSIGQPQVYGTQFKFGSGGSASQEPYNTALISDALRRQLDVPSMAVQQKQLQSLQSSMAARPPH